MADENNSTDGRRTRGKIDRDAQNERRKVQHLLQSIVLQLRNGIDYVVTAVEQYGTPIEVTGNERDETNDIVDALVSVAGEPLDPHGLPVDARDALDVYNTLVEIVDDSISDESNDDVYDEDNMIPADVLGIYLNRDDVIDAAEMLDRVDTQVAKGNNRRIVISVEEVKLRRGKIGKRISAFPTTTDEQVPYTTDTVTSLRDAIKEVADRLVAAKKADNPNTYLLDYLTKRSEYLDGIATEIEAKVATLAKAAAANASATGK